MSYSGSSFIKSAGIATGDQIDRFMADMGRRLAPNFAPDQTFKAPPPIGASIINLCAQVGVNADLVTAQIVKESAGWQSAIVRAKNNPSGLGAINAAPMAGAITFDTPEAGIQATIAHLLSYTDGRANVWWTLDPRATAIPNQNLGVVRSLSDLDGRWAVPGLGYGAGIAALANQLTAGGATQPIDRSDRTRIIVSAGHEHIGNITSDKIGSASATRLRSSTGALGRETEWNGPWADALVGKLKALGMDAVRTDAIYHADVYGEDADLMIVGHCDGTNAKRPQWCMAAAIVSGGSTDVADDRARAFAVTWYSIYPQLTGIASNGPITDDMTQEYEGWYRTKRTPAVLVEHFILGNGGVWSNDLSPEQGADADAQAVASYFGMARAQSMTRPIPIANALPRWFPETRHSIDHGFKGFWEDHRNALQLFGFPLSEEFTDGTGLTVQWFERARFEWHPGSNLNRWDVLLARIGAEASSADHDDFPAAFADAAAPNS
jgi:hypothetical protein